MKCLLKTLSWLIVSGILIAFCGYMETGSALVAIKASVWACILKTPVYWVHELIWSKAKDAGPKIVEPEVVCEACEQAIQSL
jgi:uncharacterized membrane protein